MEHDDIFQTFESYLSKSQEAYSRIKQNQQSNRPSTSHFSDVSELIDLHDIDFAEVAETKAGLRKQGINIDRITGYELYRKWQEAEKKMFSEAIVRNETLKLPNKKHKLLGLDNKAFVTQIRIPRKKHSEEERLLRTALTTKIAEKFAKRGIREFGEMALITGPDSRSSRRYYNTERLAYEALQAEKRLAKNVNPRTKQLAALFGEAIARYNSFTVDSIESIKDTNWFKSEIGTENLSHVVDSFEGEKKRRIAKHRKERRANRWFA